MPTTPQHRCRRAAAALPAASASAALDPLVFYSASTSGSGAAGASIQDQSGKGNHGRVMVASVGTSTDVPTGLSGLSYDLGEGSGSINTLAAQLLNNAAVTAAGGIITEVWVKQTPAQNTDSGVSAKLIDYAGVEKFQLGGSTAANSLLHKTKIEFRTSNNRDVTGNRTIAINDGHGII